MTSAFTKPLQLVNKFHVPGKHIPSSWIIWNLTHGVVHKITCQVDVVVVASQRWRKCDLYTEIQRVLIWLKQEEVNGSDRPIYITPLTSEACGEPHSLFNASLGPASLAAFRFPFWGRVTSSVQGRWQAVCIVVKTICLWHFDNHYFSCATRSAPV